MSLRVVSTLLVIHFLGLPSAIHADPPDTTKKVLKFVPHLKWGKELLDEAEELMRRSKVTGEHDGSLDIKSPSRSFSLEWRINGIEVEGYLYDAIPGTDWEIPGRRISHQLSVDVVISCKVKFVQADHIVILGKPELSSEFAPESDGVGKTDYGTARLRWTNRHLAYAHRQELYERAREIGRRQLLQEIRDLNSAVRAEATKIWPKKQIVFAP